MRKRTNLIRVFEDDIEWIDGRAKNFLDPFKDRDKKLTRAETVKGLRKLLDGSNVFFPDNMLNKKKKFSLEYKRGEFKL